MYYTSPTGRTGQTKRDPDLHTILNQHLKSLRLYEKRASLIRRNLAIDKAKSDLVGLEIFHVNATRRAGPCRARYKTCCIE